MNNCSGNGLLPDGTKPLPEPKLITHQSSLAIFNAWQNYTFKITRYISQGTVGQELSRSHTWWRHQMETFFTILSLCAGNSPVPGEFPTQRPVTWSFDVCFDLRPNNGWVNNREVGDLSHHRAHYDVNVMYISSFKFQGSNSPIPVEVSHYSSFLVYDKFHLLSITVWDKIR